jgi:hypothetical protein
MRSLVVASTARQSTVTVTVTVMPLRGEWQLQREGLSSVSQ